MKVKDLPKDQDLLNIPIILPDEVLKQYQDYCGGEKVMYIVGPIMGDWFMSPQPPGPKERRVYPIPIGVSPQDILEWEVKQSEIRVVNSRYGEHLI